jgi:Zn-dependent peptidase ImmA (M78 family)
MRYDRNGVPVLSEEKIELLAERFVTKVAPQCLDRPLRLPIFSVVRKLQGKHFQYVSADLGEGYLGAYDIRRKVIYIHQALLEDDPRLAFTVAHELGHFYLHGKIDPAVLDPRVTRPDGDELPQSQPDDRILLDGPKEIILGRFQTDNPRSILEWQANRFAGAILVPRRTLKAALITVQRYMGINHHLGLIWLTNQRGSAYDFGTTIKILSERYETSQAVMRIRLYTLNLVREQGVPIPMRRLGDVVGNALTDLFDRE